MTAGPAQALPRWADLLLLPVLNLGLALLAAALVVLVAGASPVAALRALVAGAFGDAEAAGYTLYYATDMVFRGARGGRGRFHAGLFQTSAWEGQAYIGGLGAALVCLHGGGLPAVVLLPAAVAAAGAVRRGMGGRSPAGCRPGGAATSSSPPSCSTSSPTR